MINFLRRVRCLLHLHRLRPFMALLKVHDNGRWITYNVVIRWCRDCGWKGGRIR